VISIVREDADLALAYAVDLSLGGIRFQHIGNDLGVEPGDLLRVILNLEQAEVRLLGKLMRITKLDAFASELVKLGTSPDNHP
jgi:hypothetical protein